MSKKLLDNVAVETVESEPTPSGMEVVGKEAAVEIVTKDEAIVVEKTEEVSSETENSAIEVETPSEAEEEDEPIEEIIVANVAGKYRRFENLTHVPAGSKTYTSKRELESNTKEQLEKMYSFVKGVDIKKFKDKNVAVENVWYAFSKLPIFDPVKDDPEGAEKTAARNKKKNGTVSVADKVDEPSSKKSYQKKREVNKYVLKVETDRSKRMIGELAPQAQTCAEILRDAAKRFDKKEFLEPELREIFEASKERLRTRQSAWRIFQYYRSDLIAADVVIQK